MKAPKTILIGSTKYLIDFVDICVDKQAYAQIFPDDKVIMIKKNRSRRQKQLDLIHEILHGLEFEYSLDIPHNLIYELEQPLLKLIQKNPRLINFLKTK